jgi:hypothetical protein
VWPGISASAGIVILSGSEGSGHRFAFGMIERSEEKGPISSQSSLRSAM